MDRTDLQELAETRLREADVLLNAGEWSGAYYLAGYAVECGLKACIAKLTVSHEFPDKDRAIKSYSHNFKKLRETAGLEKQKISDVAIDQQLRDNWSEADRWDEVSRYEQKTESEARNLIDAIATRPDGVLAWIKRHW